MQRRTSQAWRELIEAWQTSGQTQKEFCAQHSIAYSGFHYWFKKFRQDMSLPNSRSGFIPVKITPSGSGNNHHSAPIELVLPDGRRVNFHEGVDVQFLRALLA